MESNWRWNPIFWFYNAPEVILAARLITVPPPILPVYILMLRRFPFRARGVPTTDGYIGIEEPVFGVGPFPYGFTVEPDKP